MKITCITENYANKLYNIWKEHGNIIVLIDFDDTIRSFNITPQSFCDQVVETIKDAQNFGAKIILWTCRTGKRLEEAINYCNDIIDLKLDNINPKDSLLKECSNKTFGNIQLDDKAGLEQALTILQLALAKYKMYIYDNNGK